MTLPTMRSGLDRKLTDAWCAAVDEGPFRTLGVGERIAFDNLDMHTALTYAAARTDRVRLASTIWILPMHPVAVVAKQVATLDVLSGGRFDLGVGVGGRDQDYECAERPFRERHQTLDHQVAELRRLWTGGHPGVGPAPAQSGGPTIFASAMGPKSTARAARWADGNMGFTLSPDSDDHETVFGAIRAAWSEAGRERPWISTSFFYSVEPDADDVLRDYAFRYLRIFGDETAAMMAGLCSAAGIAKVAEGLDRLEAAGCDEVYLVPTTLDPTHLVEVAGLAR